MAEPQKEPAVGTTFTAQSKSADAPDIEAGVYDATFDGVEVKFIKGGQYGDGERFEWQFTLVDDDGAELYDEGEPIEVTGLTSQSTNITSKTQPRAVRYLKALMTPSEFAQFEAGEGINEDALLKRVIQVELAIKDNGWPSVVNVMPARKKRASAKASAKPAPRKTAADDVDEE